MVVADAISPGIGSQKVALFGSVVVRCVSSIRCIMTALADLCCSPCLASSFLPVARLSVVAPVAPFASCTLVASVATITSVAFACGETSFALGPQPVLRLGSPLEAIGVRIAFVYWFRVPLGASTVIRSAPSMV